MFRQCHNERHCSRSRFFKGKNESMTVCRGISWHAIAFLRNGHSSGFARDSIFSLAYFHDPNSIKAKRAFPISLCEVAELEDKSSIISPKIYGLASQKANWMAKLYWFNILS